MYFTNLLISKRSIDIDMCLPNHSQLLAFPQAQSSTSATAMEAPAPPTLACMEVPVVRAGDALSVTAPTPPLWGQPVVKVMTVRKRCFGFHLTVCCKV